MKQYAITLTEQAEADLIQLKRNELSAHKKALKLIGELIDHPTSGTGHPKPLGGDLTGQWSRRITQKHRLIYEIYETEIRVLVLSSYGHYDDKQLKYCVK